MDQERKVTRFEWKGAQVSDTLRVLAEAQARFLEDCGRMRSLTIERRQDPRGDQYRVLCRCSERKRCITASRLSLTIALEAFRAAQSSYCADLKSSA